MLRNLQASQTTPGIRARRQLAVLVLLAVGGCRSSRAVGERVAGSLQQRAAFESQPIAGGPVLLRADIALRKVMEVGPNYIRLVRNPADGDVYLLDSAGGIYRVRDISSSASQDEVASLSEIKGKSTGLAFGPDGIAYAAVNTTVDTNKTQVLLRRGVPNDNGRFTWETLASSEPYPLSDTYFDHLYNCLIVSLDGRWIYVNAGSRTDHGEVEDNSGAFPGMREVALTARILRVPINATELVLPNDENALMAQGLILARGTRNAYDMAFAPNGDLFAVDNGPDADYPDELNWIREGLHYGFPWRFGTQDNPQSLPDYDPSTDVNLQSGFWAVDHGFYQNDPGFPMPPGEFTDPVVNVGPDAVIYRGRDGKEYDANVRGELLSTFTPHRSPLGLVFATEPELPAQWQGEAGVLSAFVLSWGAAGGTLSDQGQDLLHVQLTRNGENYQARATQIARAFRNPIDSVLIENHLYVLEYGGNGAIWELTFE